LFINKKEKDERNHGGGGGVSVQRPPQGPLKISVFYPKFSKNHEIYSSLLLVADILQTTVQPSHKPLYLVSFLLFFVLL